MKGLNFSLYKTSHFKRSFVSPIYDMGESAPS